MIGPSKVVESREQLIEKAILIEKSHKQCCIISKGEGRIKIILRLGGVAGLYFAKFGAFSNYSLQRPFTKLDSTIYGK